MLLLLEEDMLGLRLPLLLQTQLGALLVLPMPGRLLDRLLAWGALLPGRRLLVGLRLERTQRGEGIGRGS